MPKPSGNLVSSSFRLCEKPTATSLHLLCSHPRARRHFVLLECFQQGPNKCPCLGSCPPVLCAPHSSQNDSLQSLRGATLFHTPKKHRLINVLHGIFVKSHLQVAAVEPQGSVEPLLWAGRCTSHFRHIVSLNSYSDQ